MNKVSRGDEFPVVKFWVLPDDDIKIRHSICQQIWKAQHWSQNWKRLDFTPVLKKDHANKCSNYHTIAIISQSSRVMFKVLEARLQQYMNWEFPDVKAGYRKVRGTRNQIANILWVSKKAREVRKNIHLRFGLCHRFWLFGWQQTMENYRKDANTRSL